MRESGNGGHSAVTAAAVFAILEKKLQLQARPAVMGGHSDYLFIMHQGYMVFVICMKLISA